MARRSSSSVWRKTSVAAAVLLVTGLVGCGESGVEAGATVSVYVEAPLCAEAKRALVRSEGRAGEVRVRAVCLDPVEGGGGLDLATVGANARRATEDSASVAYLAGAGPANRFAAPILEEAGIAFVASGSGGPAMARILGAIEDADRDSLRDSVNDGLG